MPESNDRDRVSFEEVANLARTPERSAGAAVEERSENSGLINLSEMIASEAKELPPKVGETPVFAVPTRTPATPTQKRRDGRVWMALVTGIALGLLAAAVIFAMRPKHAGPPADSTSASATRPPPERANPNAPAVHAVADDRAVDSSGLAPANAAPPKIIEPIAHVASTASLRDPTPILRPPTAALTSTAQPKTKTAGATGSPSETPVGLSADETLETLMKRAIGTGAPPAPTTASNLAESPRPSGESLPAKPALGAVQGALGTVLPGARSCLGPDDPVSRATITFKSDGSVQAVAVSGHASGEPAEECIRSRLMAARVPPFGSPTFTWTVTVRPAG